MRVASKWFGSLAVALAFSGVAQPLSAVEGLSGDVRSDIDKAVADILAKSGAPSASIAVVKDGTIAYEHAYGTATLEPKTPATPQMRYSIGSISKQFTATAILMLAEEGKLSLDDKVVRWLPDLTRANEVTIRQILSMTSGYQDFWPQDYVMPMMLESVTPLGILDRWARKPLDFEPGTKWQYSNTNYVIAGLIVEKVSGMPLFDFLQKRVFTPLRMTTVTDTDQAPLGPGEPARYMRYALGPLRPSPKEGKGWMYAAGELAMTAHDLAVWNISMIDRALMQPASYRQMETEVLLTSGAGTRYGLGVSVAMTDGRRRISHGGEVSGFTAQNNIFPDERAAVVVMTNLDATNASDQIATKIGNLLFTTTDREKDKALDEARKILGGLTHARIERSLFTANANSYFTDQALKDFAASLAPLGTWKEFTQQSQSLRGGMTLRRYTVRFPKQTLRITTFWMPDGTLEQYMVAAAE
jgi:CubicO group peptidase (beta-lactamase class C family)